MGTIKDRNGMGLTNSEDVKKTWQEYTEELYKKDLNDPGNHNGVVTHLEPDILESEAKLAIGSITTNKISGDRILDELFQILIDDFKMLHSICQQIWKLNRGQKTGKGQFSFQYQRKTMPKNVQTTSQLHLFHMLAWYAHVRPKLRAFVPRRKNRATQ